VRRCADTAAGQTTGESDRQSRSAEKAGCSRDQRPAKQQASEALKQQKISQTQKNVVTDFYKNLAPGK